MFEHDSLLLEIASRVRHLGHVWAPYLRKWRLYTSRTFLEELFGPALRAFPISQA